MNLIVQMLDVSPSENMLASMCRVTVTVMAAAIEGLRGLCSQFKPLSSITVSDIIL